MTVAPAPTTTLAFADTVTVGTVILVGKMAATVTKVTPNPLGTTVLFHFTFLAPLVTPGGTLGTANSTLIDALA